MFIGQNTAIPSHLPRLLIFFLPGYDFHITKAQRHVHGAQEHDDACLPRYVSPRPFKLHPLYSRSMEYHFMKK